MITITYKNDLYEKSSDSLYICKEKKLAILRLYKDDEAKIQINGWHLYDGNIGFLIDKNINVEIPSIH